MNDKKLSLEEVMQSLKGTLISDIIACMMTGKFKSINNKPLALGEEPLGLMTKYERACVTVAKDAWEEYNKLNQQPYLSDNDKFQCIVLFSKNNQAMGLFWDSVQKRLGDFTHFYLRRGFQIAGKEKTTPSELEQIVSSFFVRRG